MGRTRWLGSGPAASPAGDPPLSLAVRLGWLRLQQALLKAGVDREARDSHGMTALHLATALAREGALKLLVQHGASPEARAADGQTPLGVALSIGRRDLADWLDWRVWPLPRRTLREADLSAAAMAGDVDAVRRPVHSRCSRLPAKVVDPCGSGGTRAQNPPVRDVAPKGCVGDELPDGPPTRPAGVGDEPGREVPREAGALEQWSLCLTDEQRRERECLLVELVRR